MKKKEIYIYLHESDAEQICAGVMLPGSKILIWILSKIAPGNTL